MYTVQISDDLKAILDQLVAQGFAESATEVIEEAVRRCAAESEGRDAALVDAVEAGLADMCNANYITVDGPESRKTFWDGITREVTDAVAEMQSKVVRRER